MKLDLKATLNDFAEKVNQSIPKSIDNSDTTEAPESPRRTYLILDTAGLSISSVEDETLIDRSQILLAVLQYEFYEMDSLFKDLCNKQPVQYDRLDSVANMLQDWYDDNLEFILEKFYFLEGMRPYYPTDLIFKDSAILIEMEFNPSLEDLENRGNGET